MGKPIFDVSLFGYGIQVWLKPFEVAFYTPKTTILSIPAEKPMPEPSYSTQEAVSMELTYRVSTASRYDDMDEFETIISINRILVSGGIDLIRQWAKDFQNLTEKEVILADVEYRGDGKYYLKVKFEELDV